MSDIIAINMFMSTSVIKNEKMMKIKNCVVEKESKSPSSANARTKLYLKLALRSDDEVIYIVI